MTPPRFSIAHVTPHAWEAHEDALNVGVRELASGLAQRGHSVLILAPSRSAQRVRASRQKLRAARAEPRRLLDEAARSGSPAVIAVGEVLDVGASPGSLVSRRTRSLPIDVSRTIEELLSLLPLDFVHVHEPFPPSAPSAALRHSRALNVGSFHAPTERLLSSTVGRRFVESFFGRLDARTASLPATAELMQRHFPAARAHFWADGDEQLRADGKNLTMAAADVAAADVAAADVAATDVAAARENGYRVLAPGSGTVHAFEELYQQLAARRHHTRADPALRQLLDRRPLVDVDLHMHTDHSHDCATPVEVLLATAREQGLGAIAVTDHNEISGALEAREKAAESDALGGRDRIKVIVGEEIKTAGQGEVIGLFIERKIPRGLTLAETISEIKAQGGIVYVPHPFDRMHSVPDYEHLLPVLDEIDAIEVFNPRVAIGAFNEEAARFAAKYRIPAGAGSDAHVAQGLGSVRVRMHDFHGPAEFLQSLRDAQLLTKPSSLIYVQALKFLQTKATPAGARRASRRRRVRKATEGRG